MHGEDQPHRTPLGAAADNLALGQVEQHKGRFELGRPITGTDKGIRCGVMEQESPGRFIIARPEADFTLRIAQAQVQLVEIMPVIGMGPIQGKGDRLPSLEGGGGRCQHAYPDFHPIADADRPGIVLATPIAVGNADQEIVLAILINVTGGEGLGAADGERCAKVIPRRGIDLTHDKAVELLGCAGLQPSGRAANQRGDATELAAICATAAAALAAQDQIDHAMFGIARRADQRGGDGQIRNVVAAKVADDHALPQPCGAKIGAKVRHVDHLDRGRLDQPAAALTLENRQQPGIGHTPDILPRRGDHQVVNPRRVAGKVANRNAFTKTGGRLQHVVGRRQVANINTFGLLQEQTTGAAGDDMDQPGIDNAPIILIERGDHQIGRAVAVEIACGYGRPKGVEILQYAGVTRVADQALVDGEGRGVDPAAVAEVDMDGPGGKATARLVGGTRGQVTFAIFVKVAGGHATTQGASGNREILDLVDAGIDRDLVKAYRGNRNIAEAIAIKVAANHCFAKVRVGLITSRLKQLHRKEYRWQGHQAGERKARRDQHFARILLFADQPTLRLPRHADKEVEVAVVVKVGQGERGAHVIIRLRFAGEIRLIEGAVGLLHIVGHPVAIAIDRQAPVRVDIEKAGPLKFKGVGAIGIDAPQFHRRLEQRRGAGKEDHLAAVGRPRRITAAVGQIGGDILQIGAIRHAHPPTVAKGIRSGDL